MALCVHCLEDIDYGYMKLGNGMNIICFPCLEQVYRDSKLWMGDARHPWYKNEAKTNQSDRNTFRYRSWRTRVLQRDNDTCQECGSKEKLTIHHIEDFANNPEKRFEVSNGITLCSDCHKIKHRPR